jgi:hypothetical protein
MSGGEWSHVLDPLRGLGRAFWTWVFIAGIQVLNMLGRDDGATWWRLVALGCVLTVAAMQFGRARHRGVDRRSRPIPR